MGYLWDGLCGAYDAVGASADHRAGQQAGSSLRVLAETGVEAVFYATVNGACRSTSRTGSAKAGRRRARPC